MLGLDVASINLGGVKVDDKTTGVDMLHLCHPSCRIDIRLILKSTQTDEFLNFFIFYI